MTDPAKPSTTYRRSTKKNYALKLKDPGWQKRRLEILGRDEWTCQKYYGSEHTLHVHHRWYENGKAPWDAPDEALVALCEMCHKEETKRRRGVEAGFVLALRRHFLSDEVEAIAKALSNMAEFHIPSVMAGCIIWALKNPQVMTDGYFSEMERRREGLPL